MELCTKQACAFDILHMPWILFTRSLWPLWGIFLLWRRLVLANLFYFCIRSTRKHDLILLCNLQPLNRAHSFVNQKPIDIWQPTRSVKQDVFLFVVFLVRVCVCVRSNDLRLGDMEQRRPMSSFSMSNTSIIHVLECAIKLWKLSLVYILYAHRYMSIIYRNQPFRITFDIHTKKKDKHNC